MAEADFRELLKGICQAVDEAEELLDHYPITDFRRYFDEEKHEGDTEKFLRPKMMKFLLPNGKGDYIEKDIPIVSLVNHNTMDLDEVKIDMKVTGRWTSEPSDPLKKKLMVNLEPIQDNIGDEEKSHINYISIEMVFKRGCPPEGTARTLNEINKYID